VNGKCLTPHPLIVAAFRQPSGTVGTMRRVAVRLAPLALLSRLAPLALLALLACSCRHVVPLPAEALADITTLDQFRATFNAEANRHRLLVLLSPT
jgi:hypothetical protein